MIKYKILQKKLIKLSIITVVVVALLGAGAASVFSWSSKLEQDQKTAQNTLNSTRRDISTREAKAVEAQKYLELYNKIKGDEQQVALTRLDRETGGAWIRELGNQLQLQEFDGKFEAIDPISNPAFQKMTLSGISTRVKITFGATTDEQALKFVDAISTRFPGFIKIDSLVLERKEEVTDGLLQAVSKGETPSLVECTLEFVWLGIREKTEEEQKQEQANAANKR